MKIINIDNISRWIFASGLILIVGAIYGYIRYGVELVHVTNMIIGLIFIWQSFGVSKNGKK